MWCWPCPVQIRRHNLTAPLHAWAVIVYRANTMNLSSHQAATVTPKKIDDCWNRIGVRGDGTCAQLPLHIDCRNCPVHARAAAALLDQLPAEALPYHWQPPADYEQTDRTGTTSLLLFRLGDEWLALPTALFEEVTERRQVHSVPHQKNPSVLGIINIRGALVTCFSLATMLGITDKEPRVQLHDTASRLLVVRRHGQASAFHADEVHGTLRVAVAAQRPVPTTLARGAVHFNHAVIHWNGRSVGLLDEELLFHTLDRSLHD